MDNNNSFPVPTTDDSYLWDIWMSSFHYAALQIGVEKGFFELLKDNPLSTSEIAQKTGYSYRSIEAFFGLFTALGLLKKYNQKHYLAPIADTYLLESSSFFWGGIINYRTDDETRYLLRNMLEKEKSGNIGEQIHEEWEAGKMDPEKAEKFTSAMHSTSVAPAEGAARKLNLKRHQLLLDVAGGSGSYAMAIAAKNSQMRATVFELPEVAPYTDKFIKKLGLESQVSVKGGNMFNPSHWPPSYDVHFFSHIFHDWDQETCQWLADQSFATLQGKGKIVLHEMLLNDGADDNATALAFSLKMMTSMKGKQYRFEELKSILEKAGFTNVHTTPSFGHFSLIIAEKPA